MRSNKTPFHFHKEQATSQLFSLHNNNNTRRIDTSMRKKKAPANSKPPYTCGSCLKDLGKGSRTKPSIWCDVCGWVHFSCSGLVNVVDYRTRKDFLCTNCSHTRRLVPANKDTLTCSNLHSIYTNCDNPAAFGSRQSLKTVSRCSYSDVDKYSASSETYTKFKQTRKRFIGLKVQSFRLNEIWSLDLADMQKLSRANDGVRYLFVAVDTLSRFLWVYPIKGKSAKSCAETLNSIITCCQAGRQQMQPKFHRGKEKVPAKPEKIWVDRVENSVGSLPIIAENDPSQSIQLAVKQRRSSQSAISVRLRH